MMVCVLMHVIYIHVHVCGCTCVLAHVPMCDGACGNERLMSGVFLDLIPVHLLTELGARK